MTYRSSSFACLALVVGAFIPAVGSASPWPRLVGESNPECQQALQLATDLFKSDNPETVGPLPLPISVESDLLVWWDAPDISGGDPLKVDESTFESHPHGELEELFGLYLQRHAENGYRIVVFENWAGWRGNRYSMQALASDLTLNEFIAKLKTRADSSGRLTFEEWGWSWRPPLVLRTRKEHRLWVLYLGEPYNFLGKWAVFSAGPEDVVETCTVEFRPPVKAAIELVPNGMRAFLKLLDQTLGSGALDGTMQQTAELRSFVARTVANAALRPWAVTQAYSSRSSVDAGLLQWSKKSAWNARQYRAILREYPRAKRALAEYYQQQLGRSTGDARTLAGQVLDVVYRSHYIFPRSGE